MTAEREELRESAREFVRREVTQHLQEWEDTAHNITTTARRARR